jgi:hypothetical protein
MKRTQVRTLIAAAISAEAATNGSPIFGIPVVVDDGSSAADAEMETALVGGDDNVPPAIGAVIRVTPILFTRLRSAASRRTAEDAVVSASLRVHPDKIRAGFAYDLAVSAILSAGLTAGPEVASGDGDVVTRLMPEDTGLKTTGVYFTATITTP